MRKIKGFPDYQVDAQGNVWSFIGARKTKNGEVVPRKLTPIKDKSGRLRYTLVNNVGKFTKYANDLVVSSFLRPKRRTETILHLNGDFKDNSLDNLEVVAKKDLPLIAMRRSATPEQIAMTKHLRKQIKISNIKKQYVHVQQNPKASGKGGSKAGV